MRIKFLSFIASFFMVSFVITSCIDNDNDNTQNYSPNATIQAFALDTIGGYGITYKFTIDQLAGEIYNEDSLPVHADTIVDKILIKTLTTTSGIVTMKDKSGNDSIINTSDSIDLRKPIKVKVWSTEALAGVSPDQTKEYTISLRIHKHDPDSIRWNYIGTLQDEISGEQKTIQHKGEHLTYSIVDGHLKLYKNSGYSDWSAVGVNTTGELTTLPNSILPLNDVILATAGSAVYESTDGVVWTSSTKLVGTINSFVAKLPTTNDNQITYIKTIEGKRYFYSILESKLDQGEEVEVEALEEEFPVDNITYTLISKGDYHRNIIAGKHSPAIETVVNGKTIPVAVTWGYDGKTLTKLGVTTSVAYCPAFEHPTILNYNGQLYMFGDGFESIYSSINEGIAWKKTGKKFDFPHQDWSESGFTPSISQPEFRSRKGYSVVQDTENHFIYILFSKEANVSLTDHPYSHNAEVWSGRLNQLWFDLANAGK